MRFGQSLQEKVQRAVPTGIKCLGDEPTGRNRFQDSQELFGLHNCSFYYYLGRQKVLTNYLGDLINENN